MKKAVILHGIKGYAGINWQRWLCDELVKRDWEVKMPDLPCSDHPDRTEWLDMLKSLLENISASEVLLIGHSLGVVLALDYVEQLSKGKVFGLISVSGFCSDYGAPLNSYFLAEKIINFEKVRKHLGKAAVVYGDNDPYVPQETLIELATKLKVGPMVIPNGGHLNAAAGYTKFPLLLEIAGNFIS